MNYIEIVARQDELTREMTELQSTRIKEAQENYSDVNVTEDLGDDLEVMLDLSADTGTVIGIAIKDEPTAIYLTVEQFNQIGTFLGKYNDAIFSYMSSQEKGDEDATTDTIED